MEDIKISVIIPSYKPKEYLWQCIDSMITQTINKEFFEVIIVLNGCCEPWKSEIENYIKQKAGRLDIKFLQTDTPGVSNARNIGLDVMRGEYVAFVDDDDFVSPCYLEELLKIATPETIPLCYPLSFVDGENIFFKYYITNEYKEDQYGTCHFTKAKKYFSGPVYKLIHRDVIGDRRFDKRIKNGEDSLFMFLISDKMKNVSFTSTNAIYYRRIRDGSAMKKKRSLTNVFFNIIRLMFFYSIIYWRHPFKYSFSFYLTRMVAASHGFLKQIK